MEVFNLLVDGLSATLKPVSLLIIVVGIVIGIVVGAAPGLGGTVGLALTLPVALRMSPEHAITLFVAILTGTGFGGAIPAVLFRVPGTASAMLTAIEGYPMRRRGEASRALLISLYSGVIGQILSVIMFLLFVIPLSRIAVRLLFPEFFAIIVMGLVATAGLMNRHVLKGLTAAAFGLVLSLIGTDPVTGVERLTFGVDRLFAGLDTVPVIVGLLAVRQMFVLAGEPPDLLPGSAGPKRLLKVGWLSREDRREIRGPTIIGSIIGMVVGLMPGAGGTVAGFVSYDTVKRLSKDRDEFGKGSIRGLAAAESSNNAVIGGDLIPTLGLGIPGANTMVVLMAVLSAQGVVPGPQLLTTRPGLLYVTFGGLLFATLLSGVIGYLAIGPSIYLSNISHSATQVVTGVLVVIGVYSLRWSVFDVGVALVMGGFAYFADKYDYSVAAMALAFVLGRMMESSLRRGLIMAFGWSGFVSRPVTLSIFIITALLLVVPPILFRMRDRSDAQSDKGI